MYFVYPSWENMHVRNINLTRKFKKELSHLWIKPCEELLILLGRIFFVCVVYFLFSMEHLPGKTQEMKLLWDRTSKMKLFRHRKVVEKEITKKREKSECSKRTRYNEKN